MSKKLSVLTVFVGIGCVYTTDLPTSIVDTQETLVDILAPATVEGTKEQCPSGMALVEGSYCPTVTQECLRWIDADHKDKAGNISPNMCAEFRYPSTCISKEKVPVSFCVDKYEWPNQPGEVPTTLMSWVEAKSNCESVGKRLCSADEFTFACEGPNMKPYPYGDGYHRDSDVCNIDLKPWIDPWKNSFEVVDKRVPSGSKGSCHSDWGVYDIVGNVDEWVYNPQGSIHHAPWVSGLMGGHWVHGVRNRCRAMTDSHEPTFIFYVTGARCCLTV
jgi:formylglycine-generating enzyme